MWKFTFTPVLLQDLRGFAWAILNRKEEIGKMTTMIAAVYDALIEAGASEAKASAAAKSIADYEDRFNEITTELKIVKTELKLIKWISGIILAAVISILIKTFIR